MQWAQVIIVLIFLGFSGVAWVVRKLAEQKQIADAQRRRERAREEYLRTGRGGEPAPEETGSTFAGAPDTSDAQARLRELAQRRQAQLKALREKQGSGTATPAPSAQLPGAPIRTELWPGGPVIEIGPRQAPTPAMPAPRPVARPQPPEPRRTAPPQAKPRPQQRPATSTAAQARAKVAQVIATTTQSAGEVERTETSARRAKAARPQAASSIGAAGPLVAGQIDWRQAIILSEILAKPVGLRDQTQQPGL